MRKIIVVSCRDCPLKEIAFDDDRNPFYVCTHAATETFRIEHLDLIQDFCKLTEEVE